VAVRVMVPDRLLVPDELERLASLRGFALADDRRFTMEVRGMMERCELHIPDRVPKDAEGIVCAIGQGGGFRMQARDLEALAYYLRFYPHELPTWDTFEERDLWSWPDMSPRGA